MLSIDLSALNYQEGRLDSCVNYLLLLGLPHRLDLSAFIHEIIIFNLPINFKQANGCRDKYLLFPFCPC